MIKAAVFDLDDTLIDGKKMHHAAIIEALHKFGYARKRLRWIRGATTEEILSYNFPNINKNTKKEISMYKRLVVQKYMHLAKLLPYAKELLKFLKQKGLLVGMITNNSHKELEHFLKHFKIKKFFDVVVGIGDAKPKPSPSMFKFFIKKAKVSPSEMIYVGDSDYDIIACKKAKIKIILNTRIHKAKYQKMANFTAKNLKEVKKIIDNLIRER